MPRGLRTKLGVNTPEHGAGPGPSARVGTIAALEFFILLSVCPAPAQSSPSGNSPLPSFEVASVKRHRSAGTTSGHISPNRLVFTDMFPYYLVEFAYGHDYGEFGYRNLRDDRLVGAPSWLWSETYDIEAKVDDAQAEKFGEDCGPAFYDGSCGYRQPMLLMLQSLLADRFKLAVHREAKEGRVYDLVITKGGAKFLHAVPPPGLTLTAQASGPHHGCVAPPGMSCMEALTSMDLLATVLSGVPEVQRPVINQTGLKGGYYIKLQSARNAGVSASPQSESSGPTIFTALKEQLGLELKPAMGPVETLVIDHIERPSEN